MLQIIVAASAQKVDRIFQVLSFTCFLVPVKIEKRGDLYRTRPIQRLIQYEHFSLYLIQKINYSSYIDQL